MEHAIAQRHLAQLLAAHWARGSRVARGCSALAQAPVKASRVRRTAQTAPLSGPVRMAMLLTPVLAVLRAQSKLATAKAAQLLTVVPLLVRFHHLSRLAKTMTTSVLL